MSLKYDVVDVFTSEKYAGNPLAVVHVPSSSRKNLSLQDEQKIAREFHLSETVFLHEPESSNESDTAVRDIDIFTPYEQLPLAGHPTIGTAWLVGSANPTLKKAVFKVKAGAIHIDFKRQGEQLEASAVMPHNIHVHTATLPQDELESLEPALKGTSPTTQTGWPVVSLTKGIAFALIEVDSMEALGNVKAFSKATSVKLDDDWTPSFLGFYFYFRDVSREVNGIRRLHSRMIESEIGEDPVTGAASCVVSAYLAMDAFRKEGTREVDFHLTQGQHCGRPGSPRVKVSVHESGEVDKITLGGTAVRVMSGTLY